jgi:hypothetical protein
MFVERASDRSFDSDGRLRVAMAPISKAAVSSYSVSEIPGWRSLGLDSRRTYRLLRHPDALRESAPSFRGVPLLRDHAGLDEPHDPSLVVGAITDAMFDGKYLRGTIAVWDGRAISGIKSGKKRQLSAGYRYAPPDMTPGIFQGQAYDGVMRDLVCAHVALVGEGKAGPDCAL